MARIVFNSVISSIKGSIGGLTFQANASGNIARSRTRKSGRVTNKSMNALRYGIQLPASYRALTTTQKQAWILYAATYHKYDKPYRTTKLSALNWFVSLNFVVLSTGRPLLLTPPLRSFPPVVPAFDVILTSDTIGIYLNSPVVTSDCFLVISASLPVSSTSVKRITNMLMLQITPFNGKDYYNITKLWMVRHGISWASAWDGNARHIIVKLQIWDALSGLRSSEVYLNTAYPYAPNGIGYMVIGSTFVISSSN